MKKIILIAMLGATALQGCSKKDSHTELATNAPANSVPTEKWEATLYDSRYVIPPANAYLEMQPTSSSRGIAIFNITKDGVTNKEEADYEIALTKNTIQLYTLVAM